ncbi:DUF2177 family protein [Lutibacter sp.]|uniref:DUF2177 family protein n=1 Tax=Lutibacter sp. TaxID=1925666 RepID=UPI003562BEF9
MKNLLIYGIATVIFFALDMVWLGLIAKNFYREKLGFILAPDVNWWAAIIFYLIYIGGILHFAILPAMREHRWQTALIQGAVLGFLCYATYDLTNMATIKNWPLKVVVVDIIWGMVLTGSCALISYMAATKLLQ